MNEVVYENSGYYMDSLDLFLRRGFCEYEYRTINQVSLVAQKPVSFAATRRCVALIRCWYKVCWKVAQSIITQH